MREGSDHHKGLVGGGCVTSVLSQSPVGTAIRDPGLGLHSTTFMYSSYYSYKLFLYYTCMCKSGSKYTLSSKVAVCTSDF